MNRFFKTSFFPFLKFLCYLGLIYQLAVSSRIYLQYETVTRIEYEQIDEVVPSVMVCLPRLHPSNAINSFNKSFESVFINEEFEKFEKFEKFDKFDEFDNFYKKSNMRFCAFFNSCDIKRLFQNSLKFFNNSINFAIWKIDSNHKYGRFVKDKEILVSKQQSNKTTNFLELVTSRFERCFLINTNYEKTEKRDSIKLQTDKKMNFAESITLSLWKLSYPNDTIIFGLYSPEDLPSTAVSSRVSVKTSKRTFRLQFHLSKVVKLPPPFQTGCHGYGIQNGGFGSQSDCITQCMFKDVVRDNYEDLYLLFKEIPSFEELHFFINIDLFLFQNDSVRFRNETSVRFGRIFARFKAKYTLCPKLCPVDCVSVNYFLKKYKSDVDFDLHKETDNWKVEFGFIHDDKTDLFLKHSPLMDFMSLMGTVGGLGGMWVGFSFTGLLKNLSGWIWKRSRILPRNQKFSRIADLESVNRKLKLILLFVLSNFVVLYVLVILK